VGGAGFDHVIGDVGASGVDKTCEDGVVGIQFSNNAEPILVEKLLSEDVVNFFADAAVEAIGNVVDGS
jgi:hypothetical protein